EQLGGLFEKAELTGGAGNNTIVVSDLDNTIQVGDTLLTATPWLGQATLDNAANDGNYEHYLVFVPVASPSIITVNGASGDKDRLVVFGTDGPDRFTLDTIN